MIALWWCRIAVLGLIALQPLWFMWLAPPTHLPAGMLLAVMIIPLLAVLPFLWPLRMRALVMTGCLLLLYFSFAVMEAFASPEARGPAIVQIALTLLYFTALLATRNKDARRGKGA